MQREMTAFLQASVEATTAFSATNIDDLFILMMLFSPSDAARRPWQVVCGQYVGIGVLVSLSLLSLLGRIAFPEGLFGLLGLFPISLGLSQLGETCSSPSEPSVARSGEESPAVNEGIFAGVIAVAALTIANGSDNISVYIAMLANSDPFSLRVILGMFALLTGLWCLLAWWLIQVPLLARPLSRFRRDLAPLLLVAIGVLVLLEGHVLKHPLLAVGTLACTGVMVLSLMRQLRARLAARRLSGMAKP